MSAPLDIKLFVPGVPVPKGNHAAFPIGRGPCQACKPGKRCGRRNCFGGTLVGTVVSDDKAKELDAWEGFVRVHAISARNGKGMRIVEAPGALEVAIVFVLERPDGHYTTTGGLSAEGLRKPLPTVKPDWDKLSRAIADGLTGALVIDDSQIVIASVAKVYAATTHKGVAIHARQIGEAASWVTELLDAVGVKTANAAQGALF